MTITRSLPALISICIIGTFFISCLPMGAMTVTVKPAPFKPVKRKVSGKLALMELTDNRRGTDTGVCYIGLQRNGVGVPHGNITITEGKKVVPVLTKDLASALRNAGYTVDIITPGGSIPQCDAVISGEILMFWNEMSRHYTWHDVELNLSVTTPDKSRTIWSGTIQSRIKNKMSWGSAKEHEETINQAWAEALDKVLNVFSSQEFTQSMKTN